MKLGKAIAHLCDTELKLADELRTVGDRHASEQDIFHLSTTLAKQCEDHVEKLRPFAERYDEDVSGDGDEPGLWETAVSALRKKGAELAGKTPLSALLLLRDLHDLYLVAQECELDWVIVGQGAQAARDAELLEVVTACHEEAVHQAKWVRTRIKTTAAQPLVAS